VITEITQINTKQDMSRWTRAHNKKSGITWSVIAGPGGTMIIVDHDEDRASLHARNVSPGPVSLRALTPLAQRQLRRPVRCQIAAACCFTAEAKPGKIPIWTSMMFIDR
jgi:hypothetical protein